MEDQLKEINMRLKQLVALASLKNLHDNGSMINQADVIGDNIGKEIAHRQALEEEIRVKAWEDLEEARDYFKKVSS